MVVVYIWRSDREMGVGVPVRGSEAKKTEATTDLSSSSMPALAAACFTIA
jgi:hypothetical protein